MGTTLGRRRAANAFPAPRKPARRAFEAASERLRESLARLTRTFLDGPFPSPALPAQRMSLHLDALEPRVLLSVADPLAMMGAIERINMTWEGEQTTGWSYNPAISPDGQFIAYASHDSNLVPGISNTAYDVFLYDRGTGETQRVSMGYDGSDPNGPSYEPSVSENGQFVAFISHATNLVEGDTNGIADVFVWNAATGTTERVSVASDGSQAGTGDMGWGGSWNPHISPDGRYVAFASSSPDLVPEDTNDKSDIFIHDRETGTTERVSLDSDGNELPYDSYYPSFSADMRYLAFLAYDYPEEHFFRESYEHHGETAYIFLKDMQTGDLTAINAGPDGTFQPGSYSSSPWISQDGTFVVFSSSASNLVPGDTNEVDDVFLYEVATGNLERASVGMDGEEANNGSFNPSISGNGRFVAFASFADNLAEGVTNEHPQFYHFDRLAGTTQLITRGYDGNSANNYTWGDARLDYTGQFVVFEHHASNLVPDDTNEVGDIFLYTGPEVQPTHFYVVSYAPFGTVPGPVGEVDIFFNSPADPDSFSLAEDVNFFTGPQGPIVVEGHEWIRGNQLRLSFAAQQAIGDYTFSIGPDIWNVFGNLMDQNRDGTPGQPDDAYVGSFTIDPMYPRLASHTPVGTVTEPVSAMRFLFETDMAPDGFDPLADVASFEGPDGPIAITDFQWVNPRKLEISFAEQDVNGEYVIVLGPNILDQKGDPLDQDKDGVAGHATEDQYTGTFLLAVGGPYVVSHLPPEIVTIGVNSIYFEFSNEMDPDSFDLAEDVVSFEGPAGAIAPTAGSWVDANTLRVSFPEQTTHGTYSMVIGPNIHDLLGRPMDQNQNKVPGEVPEDRYTATFDIRSGPYVTGHTPSGDVEGPISEVSLTFDSPIAAATFTGDDISVLGPDGGAIEAGFTRVDDTNYLITFAPQSAPGAYHVFVGPDIENLFGLKMDQNRNGILGEPEADRYDAGFTILDLTGPRVVAHEPAIPVGRPLAFVDFTFSKAMDASTFTLDDVSIAGPGGPIAPKSVTALDATTFRVAFERQTAEGVYQFTVGPYIADLAGNLMDQDQDGQKGEPFDDQYRADFAIDLTPPTVVGHDPVGTVHAPVGALTVEFDEAIDAETFGPGEVSIVGPAGPVQPDAVTMLDPHVFRVEFDPVAAEGAFQVAIAPGVADLAGNPLGGDGYSFAFVQQFPDLQVSSVLVPAEARGGQIVDVQWTVFNNGQGLAQGTWTDTVWLSAQPVWTEASTRLADIAFDSAPDGLAPGESYTRIATVSVPEDASGDYWVFVEVDSGQAVAESDEQNNMTRASNAMSVTARPFADLEVAQVIGPDKLRSGDFATVTWRTQNAGTGATSSLRWHDAVYLSQDAELGPDDILLGRAPNPDFLAPGEWYQQTLEVAIPDNVPLGAYHVIVQANQDLAENEFGHYDNNALATFAPIDLVTPGPPVLTVTNVIAPDSIAPGERPVVTWTITNTGDSTITTGWSRGTGWDDGLALSRDTVYNEREDFFLGSHTYWHGLPLRPGESYTSTGTAERPVPNWEPGTYYIIVLPDTHFGAGSSFGQSTIARNVGPAEVTLAIADPPDLVVTEVAAPAEAVSGQKAEIGWTVFNQGAGRTRQSSWNDKIYLSEDPVLDINDILIGTFPHSGELWSGENYVRQSVSVALPQGLEGDYYLIVHTDADRQVYESDDANNTASSAAFPITLIRSDLVPAIDAAPAAGLAGETVDVEWTVRNDGPDPTAVGAWTDTLYLSLSDTLNVDDAVKLGDFAYSGGPLAPGASYARAESVAIDRGIEGTFYLFVFTDSADVLYEHEAEDNNVARAADTIAIQDLAPDLNVFSLSAPADAIAGRAVALSAEIRNDGEAAALGGWRDAVYLSANADFDKDEATLLATFERSQDVSVGESYEPQGNSFEVVLPDGIEGDYYFFLVADFEGMLYEKGRTGNNVAASGPVEVTDLKADLVVLNASAPTAAVANSIVEVGFLIANQGQETARGPWFDAFYLSADDTFNPAVDILFAAFQRADDLAVGGQYGPAAAPALARIPDRIEGQFRVFVVPDYLNQVPEETEGAAFLLPDPIDIVYQGADLAATSVSAPSGAKAGSAITVSWTVENVGQAATRELGWQDGVYLARGAELNPASDILLGLVPRTGRLDAGDSYEVSQSFTLRQDLMGTYFAYVVADARNQVYEHGLTDNNVLAAAKPTAVGGLWVDLQVASLNVPDAAAAGQSVRVEWSVVNAGRDTTGAASWEDRIYLSRDAILDDTPGVGDILLGSRTRNGVLAPGATYTASRDVVLPRDAVGDWHIIVKTDASPRNDVFERNAEDNNTAVAAIFVDYAPSPDLVLSAVSAPAEAWAGQDFRVEWTVTNDGAAEASARQGGWFDSVYLSRDQYLDRGTDIFLGSVLYRGVLAPGESYAQPQSLTARLPSGISGPFYVLVATDSNDRVDEAGAVHNNIGAADDPVEVLLAPPADLVVSDILVPDAAVYGEPAEWTYEVTNIADSTAYGAWYDTIYLSADDAWDLNDLRVARVFHQGDLGPGESYTYTVTANVPGVVPGEYYVIVRTDIRNDVRETDVANNTGVSQGRLLEPGEVQQGDPDFIPEQYSGTFVVEGRPLTLGEAMAGDVGVGEFKYYEVNAGPGQDLRLTLEGAAVGGAEVFVARGYIPSRSRFDFMGGIADPNIRIPGTQMGMYYIAVYGRHAAAGTGFELTADVLDASITSVSPEAGGSNGRVTVFIGGTGLPAATGAALVSPDGDQVPASQVWQDDATGLYATFNLAGRAPGVYDVAVMGEDAFVLGQGLFTVQEGGSAEFSAQLLIPDVVRPFAPFSFEVTYSNTGNQSMPSPILTVKGPDNVGFGFSPGEFASYGRLQFMAYSSTGPAGILPPGASETVTIYTSGVRQAENHYTLSALKVDPNDPTPPLVDWDSMKEDYRPPFVSQAEWDVLWASYTRELGATWPEVASRLAAQLTEKPHHSRPNILVQDLMQDAMRATWGQQGGGLTDVAPPFIVTHTPLYTPAGAVEGIELLFSEMIDASTFTPDDVAIVAPDGSVVPLTALAPITDRLWRMDFALQSDPGIYSVSVGPDIFDLVGLPMDQDRDGNPGEPVDDVYAADFMVVAGGGTAPTFISSLLPGSGQMFYDYLIVDFSQPIHFQTFTPDVVTVIGPFGAVSPVDVTPMTSTTYRVDLPLLDIVGDYEIVFTPGIVDLSGEPLALGLNQNGPSDGWFADQWQRLVQVLDLVGPHITGHFPGDLGADPGVSSLLVNFNEAVDPATFTPADVVLADPDGAAVAVSAVNAIDDRNFNIVFSEQHAEGRYTFSIGPDIRDIAGNPMDQNRNWISGEADDAYTGFFDVLTHELVITGQITYANYLKDYFDSANVSVQLWEQIGGKDPVPGIPSDGDEADRLVSAWNSLNGTAQGDSGASFTTATGQFRFHRDTDGEHISTYSSVEPDNGERELANYYVVAIAKNQYAMTTDHRQGRRDTPHPDNSFFYHFYPDGKPPREPAWPDIYEQVVFEATDAASALHPDSTLLIINHAVANDMFGPSEWIYFGAEKLQQATGEDPIRFIPVSAYGDNNDNNAYFTSAGFIALGTNRIVSPQTHLHEYGHAIQFAMNNYNMFPYGASAYGMIQEGTLQTTTVAEAWASFYAAWALRNHDITAYMPSNLHRNRDHTHLDVNDFWMGWDAYGLANNNAARDSAIVLGDVIPNFTGQNRNNNSGQGGRIVMGGVMSIFWDIAVNRNDMANLYKALEEATPVNTVDEFYAKYIALAGGTTARDNAINAIFIDHGIDVADDAYEPNDSYPAAHALDRKPPFEISDLILAERNAGWGDWYLVTVDKQTDDPDEEEKYTLTVGIEFEKRYGDLDLIVYVHSGGEEVFKQNWIRRGPERETVAIADLSNMNDYEIRIGVWGHGAFIPDAPGSFTGSWGGGDMNPDYTLFMLGKVPEVDEGEEEDEEEQTTAGSHDPNDKLHPGGYGEAGYLSVDTLLPYTIRYENLPEATASAVLVIVEDQLDANLDWTTFELGDMQFSHTLVEVPAGLTYFRTVVDLRDEGNDLLVEVVGDFDVTTGFAQWTFTALDPQTGELTMDPFAGFLPPNDPDVHDGEGFVKFTVRPKADLPSGTVIPNEATIFFDWNEPIDTPLIFNTIDSEPPTSQVAALPAETIGRRFTVEWDGQDEEGGSGLRSYDIYVSQDGGAYERWLANTTAVSGQFFGTEGSTYSFYSVATDNVGHVEAAPAVADATTFVKPLVWETLTPGAGNNRFAFFDADGDRVVITLAGPEGEVRFSRDAEADEWGDIVEIVAEGLDARSAILITGGDTTVYDITVQGSVGRIVANRATLTGYMDISGAASLIRLGDLAGNHVVNVGAEDGWRGALSVFLGRVQDLRFTSETPIAAFSVVEWVDADGIPDLLSAPSLGVLRATGDRRDPGVNGDFAANLTLTDGSVPFTLGTAIIAGAIQNSAWEIAGNARLVRAGSATGWTFDVAGDAGAVFVLGPASGSMNVAGSLRTLTVLGDLDADISVASVNAVFVRGGTFSGSLTAPGVDGGPGLLRLTVLGGDLDADLDLGGDAMLISVVADRRTGLGGGFAAGNSLAVGGSLFNLRLVGGDFSGGAAIGEDLRNFAVVGGDLDGGIAVGGDMGRAIVNHVRWEGGSMTANGALDVAGDLAILLVGGDFVGRVGVDGEMGAAIVRGGDFAGRLDVGGGMRALNVVAIAGQGGAVAGGAAFDVGGDVRGINLNGGGFLGEGAVGGSLGAMNVRGGDFGGVLVVGDDFRGLNVAALRGMGGNLVSGARVNAGGALNRMLVGGDVAGTAAPAEADAPANLVQVYARDIGAVNVRGSVEHARILAGGNLGANWRLGGDDIFEAGQIRAFNVRGNVNRSLVGAGLRSIGDTLNLQDHGYFAESQIGRMRIGGELTVEEGAMDQGIGSAAVGPFVINRERENPHVHTA